jgi:SAM-dependent methyltransferase
MLTVDFDRLGVRPGTRVLDLGCGQGRHAFEALRRGAEVVAADLDDKALVEVEAMALAMEEAGELTAGGRLTVRHADALRLPFDEGQFDVVIVSEVLEHIPEDRAAMAEIHRVVKPGGLAAITVPRRGPEEVCWALSHEYHNNPGGHIRIYRGDELLGRLCESGLVPRGRAHAHALHSPYWWLKCAVGVRRDDAVLPALYHRFLAWEMVSRPAWSRLLERGLNPLLGKSLVLYMAKPQTSMRQTSMHQARKHAAA